MSKEEFKVGDWIVTFPQPIPNPVGQNVGQTPGGAGFKPNKLLEIVRFDDHSTFKVYWIKKSSCGIYSGNFRHATEQEIKEQRVIITQDIYPIW